MTSPGTPTSQVTSSALRATGLGVTYGEAVAPVIDAAPAAVQAAGPASSCRGRPLPDRIVHVPGRCAG